MDADALTGGFTDAPLQSSRAFRAALQAMARPGTIWTVEGAVPPAPLSVAAGVLILTLCDSTTPLHLAPGVNTPVLRDWITFHTAAPLVGAGQAQFACGTWADLLPLSRFAIGTPDYPDRAATLIVELPDFAPANARMTGPGIADHATLALPDIAAFRENRAAFPQGFDSYLTCGTRLAAVPRSTIVEAL